MTRRTAASRQNSHMLQSANLALQAGYDENVVVACALHDTGHQIRRVDHGHWGSNLLEGYVDEEIVWAIKYHQSLRFFPDPDYDYEYPEMYIRIFGEDYVPDEYQQAHHDYARGPRVVSHRPGHHGERRVRLGTRTPRWTTSPSSRWWPGTSASRRKASGFDNSHNAHFWRSIIWPNRPL